MPADRLFLRIFNTSGQIHGVLTEMTEAEIHEAINVPRDYAEIEWIVIDGIRDIDDTHVQCRFRPSIVSAYFIETWVPSLMKGPTPAQGRLVQ